MRPGPWLVPLLAGGLVPAALLSLLGGPGALTWLAWLLVLSVTATGLAARGRLQAELGLTGPAITTHRARLAVVLAVLAPTRARVTVELAWPQGLQGPHLVDLPGRGASVRRLELGVVAAERGRHRLGACRVWASDAFGLFEWLSVMEPEWTVEVHPPSAALEVRSLATLAAGEGRRSARLGAGLELESLRPYVPGDDPRAVCWPATARLARPVVRTFRGQEHRRVIVALDVSRRMGARVGEVTRLDRAVDVALAVARLARARHDRVVLTTFDRALTTVLPDAAGPAPWGRLGLEVCPTDHETDYGGVLAEVGGAWARRSLLVLVTEPEEGAGLGGPGDLLAALETVGRHAVLVVAPGDDELATLAGRGPRATSLGSLEDLHRRAAALGLLEERQRALALLRRRVPVLELATDGLGGVLRRVEAARREA